MENVKKKGFDKKITIEMLLDLKKRFRDLPEMTHEARARAVAADFPQFAERTLKDYSCTLTSVCDEVFEMVLQGHISLTAISEFTIWEKKTQVYMAKEYVEKKLTPSLLRMVKKLKSEHDVSFEEAIGRATGSIPMDRPRKEQRKDLDQILTEIADGGARWRAKVDMAIEMVGDEEAAAGVHLALFEKVCLLRELVGNQYDMVNGRFNRYVNSIKKRLRQVQGEPEGPVPEKIVDASVVTEGGNKFEEGREI